MAKRPSSGSAVQRAEKRVLKAVVRFVRRDVDQYDWEEHDTLRGAVERLQRARAAARRQGTR